MGLANDEAIKAVVDGLTLLLNILNKIIDIISGENGAIKSITSLGLAFGALKVGGSVFEAAFSTFGQAAASAGKDASFNFSKSFSANLKTQFGKTGDFFKILFPKRDIKKGIKSSGLPAILENVDLSKLSNNVKIDLKNSLWNDFTDSIVGIEIDSNLLHP